MTSKGSDKAVARKQRLGSALRANLQKRKAQARARAPGENTPALAEPRPPADPKRRERDS